MYDAQGTYHFFGVKFCPEPRFLGRNSSKVQIFGVEFRADPRFLWSFFRRTCTLRSIFRKILILEIDQFLRFLSKLVEFTFLGLFFCHKPKFLVRRVVRPRHFHINVTPETIRHQYSLAGQLQRVLHDHGLDSIRISINTFLA